MNKETGGPAFPDWPESAFPSTFKSIDDEEQIHRWGMTLRDYFAAKAMQGWLVETSEGVSVRAVARFSYEMADAMLEARKQ